MTQLQLLTEAIKINNLRHVVQSLINDNIDELYHIVDNNQDETIAASKVADKLTEIFKDVEFDINKIIHTPTIKFMYGSLRTIDYVAVGETDTNTGNIEISIGIDQLFSGDNSLYNNEAQWVISMTQTITHELLHHYQVVQSNFKVKPVPKDAADIEYFSNIAEIQSQAKDAVDFIISKTQAKTSTDVNAYIKDELAKAIVEIPPIKNYYDLFKGQKIWNTFMKYVYFYANDLEND